MDSTAVVRVNASRAWNHAAESTNLTAYHCDSTGLCLGAGVCPASQGAPAPAPVLAVSSRS